VKSSSAIIPSWIDSRTTPSSPPAIEVRIAIQDPLLLLSGRMRQAVDIVVPVPLDVGTADEGGEREVLLERDPAWTIRSSADMK
jgi:hypothetical protein